MTDTEALADVIADCIRDATTPLLAKIAVLEAQPVAAEVKRLEQVIGDLRERLAAVEARAPIPGPQGLQGERGEKGEQGIPGRDGDDGPIGPVGPKGADGLNGKDGRDGLDGKDGAMGLAGKDGKDGLDGKDGAAGLNGKDGRDGQPGVPGRWGDPGRDGLDGKAGINGRDGKDGKPGLNGKDGRDGLGFDDLDVLLDPSKGWVIRFTKGSRVVDRPVPFPYDAGVWTFGQTYHKGAGVTLQGAWWIAQESTRTRPGDGSAESSKAWRLAVKGGRDGKPGKDGRDAVTE